MYVYVLNKKLTLQNCVIVDHRYKKANIIVLYLVNYKSAMIDQL